MAEDLKHHGANSEMEFERQDMSPRGVYAFLIGLAVGGVLVSLLLWGVYHSLDAYERKHQPQPNPLAPPASLETRSVSPDEITKFPQPRLEKNERLEINDFRLKEEQTLNSYGWVDEKAGIARIPIERAMELIAQRGLPTTPKAGTVPPSELNVVNQAARRADTSNLPKRKAKQ